MNLLWALNMVINPHIYLLVSFSSQSLIRLFHTTYSLPSHYSIPFAFSQLMTLPYICVYVSISDDFAIYTYICVYVYMSQFLHIYEEIHIYVHICEEIEKSPYLLTIKWVDNLHLYWIIIPLSRLSAASYNLLDLWVPSPLEHSISWLCNYIVSVLYHHIFPCPQSHSQ